jgi:pyrimidine deaminase RibD-like protein
MQLSTKQQNLLHRAMTLALDCKLPAHHACMLVINGKVISTGINHYRGCLNNKYVPFIHAEVCAIWKLLRQDKQCFL